MTQLFFNYFSWECNLLGVLPIRVGLKLMRTEIFHGVTRQRNMRRWRQVLGRGFTGVPRVESPPVQEEFLPQEVPHSASSLEAPRGQRPGLEGPALSETPSPAQIPHAAPSTAD